MLRLSFPAAMTFAGGTTAEGGGPALLGGIDVLLAARAFGMLEVALVGTGAFFELDFSASSPLSESESLLSEESDESLEEEDPLPSFSFLGGAVVAEGAPDGAAGGGGDPVLFEPSLRFAGP